MILSYDNYDRLEQSKLFLANPQKNNIGELGGVKNLHLKINLNAASEATFKIYKYENSEENEFYDKIENKRLIEIQYVGWFQIVKCEEHDNGVNPFKNVSLISLENQLTSKKITNLNGTYYLYNNGDHSKSLLHIIADITGWMPDHIDNDLLGKQRTFNINSDKVYSFLMSTCATSFNCIFQFNSFSRTISVYKLENIGKVTDIVISRNNILQEFIKESSADKLITKLRILGGNGIDISNVNPTGTDYLINIDNFMTSNWMSQSLINSLEAYRTKYNSYVSSYTSAITLLKTKQAELTILNNELNIINTNLKNSENTKGDIVSDIGHAPTPADNRYTEYQQALTNISTYTSQRISKEAQITSKQNEINVVQATLNSINNELSMENNFTDEALEEIDVFLTEDAEYQDNSFTASDDMTQDQITAMEQELLENGFYQLSMACKPQYVYKTTGSNLFSIMEDRDNFISYKDIRQDLEVGNYITIKVRDDYYITVRLLSIEFDFDKLEDIELVFSDLPRETNTKSQYAEILAQATKTSSSYSFSKIGYDKAASITDEVQEFITGALNATLNKMVNNDNQELVIDKYGLHMRKWLPDQNKYDNHQAWWNNQTLLFTDSNWVDSKTGIGLFTDPEGNTAYSVIADVLAGNIVISSKLNVSNKSGTYTITDATGFQASKNGYTVSINPSTPAEIFKISVSGSPKMYMDTVNSRLVLNAEVNANYGNIGGWNITSDGLSSYNTIASINLYNQGNQAMRLSYNGMHLFNHYSGSNEYLGGAVAVYSAANGTNGMFIGHAQNAEYLALGYADSTYPYSGMPVSADLIYTRNGYSTIPSGFNFFKSLYVKSIYDVSTITTINYDGIITDDMTCNNLNGYTPINSNNISTYSVTPSNISNYSLTPSNYSNYAAPSSHMQSSYTITPTLTAAQNISLYGEPNAASTWWVNANFQLKTASDFRLKKNIQSFDSLPDELFYELKPKQYEFKADDNHKGICFGLLAQQVISAFERYGLNALDYNLVELSDARSYTDEVLYVKEGKMYRINYQNFHAWSIHILQKINSRLSNLEGTIIKLTGSQVA
jgi:hypothetical protein